jgi:hypothetical protein
MTPCHHLDGVFWCDRKAGHRKPHRYVLPPTEDLYKRIFEVFAVIHPNSIPAMGWVIPAEVRQRLVDESMASRNRDTVFLFRPDDPPPQPLPDQLLGRPVRIGGRSILLEVVRRS